MCIFSRSMVLATAQVKVTSGGGGSSRRRRHTNTPTYRHRHTHLRDQPAFGVFSFAYLCLPDFLYSFCVASGECGLHSSPFLIAQRHKLRGTTIISLASAVSKRSLTFPHNPVLSTFSSLGLSTAALRTRYGTHTTSTDEMRGSALELQFFSNGSNGTTNREEECLCRYQLSV